MMNALRELLKLFVDDGTLAASLVAVIILAEVAVLLMPDMPMTPGAILLFGSLAALFFSIGRADQA
jgi:uncharacterized membrane protein YdjX (TVP38/TMEM64 family)